MAKNDKENNKLSDIMRKVVSTGVGAAFMAEDAVKSVISELPLPKDAVEGLIKNAKSTRDEFISTLKTEITGYLNKLDLTKEIEKIVDRYDFEIQAKVSLKRKEKTDSDE